MCSTYEDVYGQKLRNKENLILGIIFGSQNYLNIFSINAYALRGNNSQHFSSFRCNYKLHQEKRKKFLFFNLNKSTPNDFPESYSTFFSKVSVLITVKRNSNFKLILSINYLHLLFNTVCRVSWQNWRTHL